jgi:hypothetical protein
MDNGLLADRLAYIVESSGSELAVTIIVDGTIITGMLCSFRRYLRWDTEVGARSLYGTQRLSGPMKHADESEMLEIRNAWLEREREWRAEHGDEPFAPAFVELCVRNAQVRVGASSTWVTLPYLAIDGRNVSGIWPERPLQRVGPTSYSPLVPRRCHREAHVPPTLEEPRGLRHVLPQRPDRLPQQARCTRPTSRSRSRARSGRG